MGSAARKLFHVLFGDDPDRRRQIYWMIGAFVAVLLVSALERWG